MPTRRDEPQPEPWEHLLAPPFGDEQRLGPAEVEEIRHQVTETLRERLETCQDNSDTQIVYVGYCTAMSELLRQTADGSLAGRELGAAATAVSAVATPNIRHELLGPSYFLVHLVGRCILSAIHIIARAEGHDPYSELAVTEPYTGEAMQRDLQFFEDDYPSIFVGVDTQPRVITAAIRHRAEASFQTPSSQS